ncbi:Zn(2)-C6 fungal-type domain-containing protein [Mycena indigotica]|uniref:Zn(2)-C6 fungal-type domain-containing protein n=1 Tax=Mycena indigotica TaxID=2126181 RepID=A0A8H6SB88_9AGAR|nr:Zn(2)-C6 fungal-type domain-containing protein [Mycena indigotica]KAF7295575.1 Zn(2)-C6 fungal-type domain-containing protein [Mycena indigotica]
MRRISNRSILTLPHEVISEILVHSLPVYPLCPPLTGLESPTRLLSVCRLFRKIGSSTPLLWRAFQVNDGTDSESVLIKRVHTWLARSGATPLSIRFDFDPDLMDRAVVSDLLTAIVDNHGISLVRGPAPLLKEMRIMVWEESLWDVYLVESVVHEIELNDVPRLRSVRFWDVECTVDSLPWSQLTSLTLQHKSLGQCLPLLTRATNLVRCSLGLCDEDPPMPVVVRLPFLETLILRSDSFYDPEANTPVTQFLAYFHVPAVKQLQVPRSFLSIDPVAYLEVFTTRCDCRIHSLCITAASDCEPDDFKGIVTADGQVIIIEDQDDSESWKEEGQ